MVNKNVPEDTVYKLVKAICESRDDIVIASPFSKSFTAKEAGTGLAVPLHPGAAKCCKEMGYIQ